MKKSVWLELLVTVLLGGTGYWGIRTFAVPVHLDVSRTALAEGFVSFLAVSGWTLVVQRGYALVKGEDYARKLTISLAKEYAESSLLQAVLGGFAAAFGEEIFFRGFVQGEWGVIASTLLFGLAHFGKKDIRVVSYWSFAHGLLFGLAYLYTHNLVVPMMAHGLFDLGGFIYFREVMRKQAA